MKRVIPLLFICVLPFAVSGCTSQSEPSSAAEEPTVQASMEDANPEDGEQSSPAPAYSQVLTVNTHNTYGEDIGVVIDGNPGVFLRPDPTRNNPPVATVQNGESLTARCWVSGESTTDGSNQTTEDDARTFTSSLWYGVDWNGGPAYISAVWSTKQEDHLQLQPCDI